VGALKMFKQRRGYDDTISSVEQLLRDLTRIQGVLERCAESLREAEHRVGERDPGSEVWWNTRTRAIANGLSGKGDSDARALDLWRETWVMGIALQAWHECGKLVR